MLIPCLRCADSNQTNSGEGGWGVHPNNIINFVIYPSRNIKQKSNKTQIFLKPVSNERDFEYKTNKKKNQLIWVIILENMSFQS